MVRIVDRVYEPRGAALELLRCTDPEVLIEGPAGTGKTRALLFKAHYLASKYPGSRGLLFRETRASMTQSVLVEFEANILPPDHPSKRGAHRRNRNSYIYPNGSELVLAGMDATSRIMSSQYDFAFGFEATEMAEAGVQDVTSRLRNNKIPVPPFGPDDFFTQLGLDCNPDSAMHWLNLRPDRIIDDPEDPRNGQPQMTRLLSRHGDNPSLTAGYLSRLRRLTGVRRARLYEGKWVSGVGQIYDMFDAAKHMVHAEIEKRSTSGTYYKVRNLPEFTWHVAGVDWGYARAGVMNVWGVTRDRRMYRVAEVYRRGKNVDWWADKAVELRKRFDIARFICDSAEPEFIDKFNDRLGTGRGRDGRRLALPAEKAVLTGINVVRDLLTPDEEGRPRMMFVKDALVDGADSELLADRKPTCTEQEIPGYVYAQNADGSLIKEKPDPECEDHGLDATRYAAMYVWGHDFTDDQAKPKFRKGTLGDILRHENVGQKRRDDRRWV